MFGHSSWIAFVSILDIWISSTPSPRSKTWNIFASVTPAAPSRCNGTSNKCGASYYGARHNGALSNNPLSSSSQASSKIWMGVGLLDHKANGISCPLLWFFSVRCCYLLHQLQCCCQFALAFWAVWGQFLPVPFLLWLLPLHYQTLLPILPQLQKTW